MKKIFLFFIIISFTKNENLTNIECDSDFICTAIDLNSYCDLENNECECLPNFYYNSTLNMCKIKYYLNISCSSDKECSKYEKNGICDGFGSCVCAIGFSWNFEKFSCEFDGKSIENLMCNENDEICLKKSENSNCHDFYCKCNENYNFDLKKMKCVNNNKIIKINVFFLLLFFYFCIN